MSKVTVLTLAPQRVRWLGSLCLFLGLLLSAACSPSYVAVSGTATISPGSDPDDRHALEYPIGAPDQRRGKIELWSEGAEREELDGSLQTLIHVGMVVHNTSTEPVRLDRQQLRLDDVLRFYSDCLRELGGSGLVLDSVNLSPRGGWRLHLAAGTVIELGHADAMEHLKRFLDVWPRIASTSAHPPQSVDLRYANGFAVRWAPPVPSAGNGESGTGNGQNLIPPDAGVHGWHPPAGELLAQADTGSSHSGFPIPDSRLLAHSLFPISYSPFPIAHFPSPVLLLRTARTRGIQQGGGSGASRRTGSGRG